MTKPPSEILSELQSEHEKFRHFYVWLMDNMPQTFFGEVDQGGIMLIVHHMMELEAQKYFSIIQLKYASIVICLEQPDADLRVLKHFSVHGIQDYQVYISKTAPAFLGITEKIRIVIMHFYGDDVPVRSLDNEVKQKLHTLVLEKNPNISEHAFESALKGLSPNFLHALPLEKLALVICMYFRAATRDKCQYEVIYHEETEKKEAASMELVFAWRNTPRHNFLYRLIRVVHRHGLVVKSINASYNNLYQVDSILAVVMEIQGRDGRPVWQVANILDFVKELTTVKYFASFDAIDRYLVHEKILSGNMGNFLRAMEIWIHQALVHIDVNSYTLERIEEGLCRHPELTAQLCEAFKSKFDPFQHDLEQYEQIRKGLLADIEKLDTGHEENDIRRKNVLLQGLNFIHYSLKTNFFRPNYTALSFRVDPKYLDEIPFDRTKKFPELPYGIIFVKGMHFFGFHVRFKDLARGGLRTVYPEFTERMLLERNTIFTECYNLALTQHMKNKDIPEGGAKGIILLQPYEHLESETLILKHELQLSLKEPKEVEQKLEAFRYEQRLEHLYQAQRSFIESLITIVNTDPDGKLRAKDIIDYWGKPEYLYLGPDENLHDSMIQWIDNYSRKHHYKPGSSFISGKPKVGINHKEYGVTSLGLNVYVDALLRYLGIDPTKNEFTVKMSGGPDGDVAGNQIHNLYRYYRNTAKLVALTDISGTIFDPRGLDLQEMVTLVKYGKSIKYYPPEKLNEGGFLVDKFTKRTPSPLVQQTLCWRRQGGKLVEDWLSGSDMNHLLRHNVHQVNADIFIPAGGRPRTINESNYRDFLDIAGKPTARGIVEGANLYLTNGARRLLEDLGVLIIKDSSANKTGVICSSFEVLCGLTMGDDQFIAHKETLVKEILARLEQCAANEASLLLRTHSETGERLTEISDKISKRINQFTDQLLNYFEHIDLSENFHDPLIRAFLSYCLPLLRQQFQKQLLNEIPEQHKKAIIACHIAAHVVYLNGLSWFPSIVDILPILLDKSELFYTN